LKGEEMNNQSGEDKYSLPSFNSQGIVKSCVVEDNSIEEREKEISKDIFRTFIQYAKTFREVELVRVGKNTLVRTPKFNMFVAYGRNDIILNVCELLREKYYFDSEGLYQYILYLCNNLKTIKKEETMSKPNLPNRAQHNMFFNMLKLAKYEGVFHNSEFIVNTGTSSLVVPYDVVPMYNFCLDLYDIAVEIPENIGSKSNGECYKVSLSEFYNTLSPEQQFMVDNRDTKTEETVVEEKTEEGTKITFYIIRQERKDLIDEIAETTKTLLSFDDKTSWMYKQSELQLEYLNAKFACIEDWYQKNK